MSLRGGGGVGTRAWAGSTKLYVALVAGVALAAHPTPVPTVPRAIASPPPGGRFDYQIGGAYPPERSVTIVDRDHSDKPVPGKYNICYINAFQTQAGEADLWRGTHRDLLLKTGKDGYVEDPDWPGEYLLDTSTATARSGIAKIVNGWIDDCADRGFQAVEPDNLDSWTRSRHRLRQADNVRLGMMLAAHAHARGLAIAQKNAAELGRIGKTQVGFDFAIAEECQVHSECGAYTGPYGRNVIEVEYTDNGRAAFTRACAARGAGISVILRDRDVVAAGQPGYHEEFCHPAAAQVPSPA